MYLIPLQPLQTVLSCSKDTWKREKSLKEMKNRCALWQPANEAKQHEKWPLSTNGPQWAYFGVEEEYQRPNHLWDRYVTAWKMCSRSMQQQGIVLQVTQTSLSLLCLGRVLRGLRWLSGEVSPYSLWCLDTGFLRAPSLHLHSADWLLCWTRAPVSRMLLLV